MEWVGIDGLNSTSLIQAGVEESENDGAGDCAPTGEFYLWPWWEVLPYNETQIAGLTVSVGDSVTIDILSSSGTWVIEFTDDTTGAQVTIVPSEYGETYSGSASSAEWIVEAPTDPVDCGGTCVLPPFCVGSGGECVADDVPFSSLGISGPETDLYDIWLVQDGNPVAEPGDLANDGFDVYYVGSQASYDQSAAPSVAVGIAPHGIPVIYAQDGHRA